MKVTIFLILVAIGLASCHPKNQVQCDDMDMMSALTMMNPERLIKKLSPMGCFDLMPNEKSKGIMMKCFKGLANEAIKSLMNGQLPTKEAMREEYSKGVLCKYTDMGLVDGETLLTEKFEGVFETHIDSSDAEDLKTMEDMTMDCAEDIDEDLPIIEQISELELCISNKMIDHCEGHGESSGALPILAAFASMLSNNKECSNVKINEEITEVYAKCMKEGESPDLKTALKGVKHPLKRMMVEKLLSIPEIQAMRCTGKQMNLLTEDDMTKYDELAKLVGTFKGWNDDEDRDELVQSITMCGNDAVLVTDQPFKQDMVYTKCLIPKLAEICGLDNDLTMKFLVPIFDPEMQKLIMNGLKSSMKPGDPASVIFERMSAKFAELMKKIMPGTSQ